MAVVLNHVAKKERFSLPNPALTSITQTSSGNLRKALLMLEAMKMQKPDMSGEIEVAKPDWETYCAKVGDLILGEQSAQRLLEVRGKVYELLSHCIPPTVVLKVSCIRIDSHCLLKSLVDDSRADCGESGRRFETSSYTLGCALCQLHRIKTIWELMILKELRMRMGSKKIFHIEAFVAKIMR
jgi:replication factor C subunit 3/5